MAFKSFLSEVGLKITEARKAKDLTQRAAAEQAGISYRYFQSIELGSANITLQTLFRLAKFFDVHVTDLLPAKHESRIPSGRGGR